MSQDLLERARRLADDLLAAGVKSLAARERTATAELIAHLAEFDARRLYLPAGYSSMFVYCRDALMLSEHAAYNRIEAASARRFPVILEMLDEGAVNLTTVRLLAPHLTSENHVDVLASARGRRRSEVERMVAALAPQPDAPATIRKLPAPAPPVAVANAHPPEPAPTVLGTAGEAVTAPVAVAASMPARAGPSSSFTMSTRSRSMGRPPLATSSCAAGGTTLTNGGSGAWNATLSSIARRARG
jgi:hypothetical protein